MAAILGFSLCVLLVLLLIPDSQLGRMLHRQLVERPLEALSDIRRHHVIFFVIIAGFAVAGGEAMALLGPEIVAAYALDLAIYLDAVLVTYALSAVAMAKSGGGWLKNALMRSVRRMRPRSRRAPRRPAGPRKSANDDDPAPAVRCAA